MTGAEFVVDTITQMGTTDVFGIPGAVVLDFLYAVDKHPGIEAHLNYHEQMSSYAAIGYAQASGKLGVAYSTRGPGVANMMTAISEAYFESVAVLFLSAHSSGELTDQRFVSDQEVDFTESIKRFSKFSGRIDTVEELTDILPKACDLALSGRRGPVFIDINSSLWSANVEEFKNIEERTDEASVVDVSSLIRDNISGAKRPVILIGEGVRLSDSAQAIEEFAINNQIPVLSSRGTQDILAYSQMYYGYIGSHGVRYSNFILSKADLIISFGNRLSFPLKSQSFESVYRNAKIIRIDVDETELERDIPNSVCVKVDLIGIKNSIRNIKTGSFHEWNEVCRILKNKLLTEDITGNVKLVSDMMKKIDYPAVFVSDVGNNEFYVSRAFEFVRPDADLYFSRSYGTLGVGIGKAIGVYYATHKPVVCFIGDQGFQYNSQELQYIAHWQIPVSVIVLNNHISAMIRDKEVKKYRRALHTTGDTGYSVPDLKKVAEAYSLDFWGFDEDNDSLPDMSKPRLIEIVLDPDEELAPTLPVGNPCQDMSPLLDRRLYEELNSL